MEQELRGYVTTYFYMEQELDGMAHDEEEYLDAIRDHSPASTSEIAEAVGVTRQGADYRLRQLRDEGKVEAKMVGNSLIWMVAGEEDD